MTKYKILIFAFLPLCLFGDCADCEAYKTQVASDCDSIISSCDSAIFDCQSAASSAELFAGYYGSNSTERVALVQVAESASSASGTILALKAFAQSIKATVQSLQCSSNSGSGSCDCASYLQSLSQQVSTINANLISTLTKLDNISSSLNDGDLSVTDYAYDIANSNNELMYMLQDFLQYDDGEVPIKITDFSSVTNVATYLRYLVTMQKLTKAQKIALGMSSSSVADSMGNLAIGTYRFMLNTSNNSGDSNFSVSRARLGGAFFDASTFSYASLQSLIKSYFTYSLEAQVSLNNYAYTNLQEFVACRESLGSLSSNFSIFNDFVFSSDSPLSMYTDYATNGSYHDYLTNYYIKVSKGQQSGSDNFTNWFSRIEILLASLVFRDDGTNFVDNADNTTELENTLSQSVDTLSQAVSLPQNVTGKIDNMGQSFLGLLGEWRTIVSGNSLPSQFVLCDINLGSQSRDSSGGSSVSSFRLETSLDSGEFRQFLDFCHAVTTILFTMLFVWLSVMLLSFLLASLAKLAQFCYLVYSALFGG